MKFCVSLTLLVSIIALASCRPQSVQIEEQKLLHLQRAVTNPSQERRGSLEETRRILSEIDRINVALGYTKRMTIAFPRVANGEGYFYPRQQFRPEFLTKGRDKFNRMNNRRAINPFTSQNYYYPAPYLQVPIDGRNQEFQANKYFYPFIYSPVNVLPYNYEKPRDDKDIEGSIRLGTIVVLPKEHRELFGREPKAAMEAIAAAKKAAKVKGKPAKSEESIIDQIVNYVPDALGLSDDDDEERQVTVSPAPKLPSIKNDKFLNLALKKHPQEGESDAKRTNPPPLPMDRAFNFSNPIEKLQNFTKVFQFNQSRDVAKDASSSTTTDSPTAEDIEDAEVDKADDKEDEKSPFGFAFGPQQQLQTYKEGGLIIQRLRVRHGGIAIAGPGGVATAGSGGTAIVGPNGIAFTHPRGLAIGGPGAKIYAMPESTDLENLALTHKARNLNLDRFLVANGPVVYYNEFEHVDDAVRLPYIGGAKGQVLEIRQRPDGSIFSRILTDEVKTDLKKQDFDGSEGPKDIAVPEVSFEESLASIQRAAAELVQLQQAYKENGRFSEVQKKKYSESLEKLGISAQKLANVQDDDDYRLLFEEPQGDRIKGSKKKPENIKFPPYATKRPSSTTAKKEECGEEETVGEEGDSTTGAAPAATTSTTTTKKPPQMSSNSDTVSVTADEDEESSVAEAKPVGLAIAGVGGVASSKPVATAVVGPGGLAVARPVATAIAGVKPSDISALGLPIPSKLKDLAARGGNFPSKGKYGLVSLSDDDGDERVLVGPDFFTQARLSEKASEYDNEQAEGDESENDDREISRRPDTDYEKEDMKNGDRQVEPVDNMESPYGIEYGKQPLFPPSYEGLYNFLPNPYLPPYNFNNNVPLPIINQYLQRRIYNAGLRYPSAGAYPEAYGQPHFNTNPSPYSPFNRYFYVQ